jgi:ribonuclease BN (tRNA processing enzyme)
MSRPTGSSSSVRVTFAGTGDAWGSGGRLQTCLLVDGRAATFLIDCGASSLPALKRIGRSPGEVDLIVISHLHGDHFAGIPFLLLEAQHASKRTRPLTITGPPGLRTRLKQALDVLFPGAAATDWRFPLEVLELEPEARVELGPVAVTAFSVVHPSGAPPLALRFEYDGFVIAYSGDTEWTDALVRAAQDADLFIAEGYTLEERVRYHLDVRTLTSHLDEIGPKRLILTHMSDDVLMRLDELAWEPAEDGMTLVLERSRHAPHLA